MQTLLDQFGVSRLFGLTTRKVAKLVREDAIPHIKLPNGEIRFDTDDLQEWRDKPEESGGGRTVLTSAETEAPEIELPEDVWDLLLDLALDMAEQREGEAE